MSLTGYAISKNSFYPLIISLIGFVLALIKIINYMIYWKLGNKIIKKTI